MGADSQGVGSYQLTAMDFTGEVEIEGGEKRGRLKQRRIEKGWECRREGAWRGREGRRKVSEKQRRIGREGEWEREGGGMESECGEGEKEGQERSREEEEEGM